VGQYEHPRWGIDFVWFAVDALGHAGYFDSAGHGPVPAAVMPHIEELDAASDRLEELPVLGPCAEQPTKPGIFPDWIRPAERGFYADFSTATTIKLRRTGVTVATWP
jgi:hypothetical protein